MRIVLLNPMVTVFGWGCYYKGERHHCSIPHGLLSIATLLNQSGHQCAVIDMRDCASLDDTIRKTLAYAPQMVGVGAMSLDFGVAMATLLTLKNAAPEIKTVIGGVHATIRPEDAHAPFVDHIVKGEGELPMLALAAQEYVQEEVWGDRPNLDHLPIIDRTLVDAAQGEMRAPYWKGKTPYHTVMAGRGCPFQCGFCAPVSMTMFSRVRQRCMKHLMPELRQLKESYGAGYFDFIDDTFTISQDWTADFCVAYKENGLGVPFVVASRADIITKWPEMFARLRAAGCDTVSVGFESGNDRVLGVLRKGTTREMNLEAARVLRANGLQIVANIIYGTPTETPDEARDTGTMLDEIKPNVYSPAWFTPYPGCYLYDEYKEDSLVVEYSDMHRYANKPKMRGVDYAGIQAAMWRA